MFSTLFNLLPSALDFLGGEEDRDAQREANDANLAAQREFAQKGIQWRAEDARLAGLHPLAAIGSAGASFSPSFQVAGGGSGYRAAADLARSMMGEHGQNTGRAGRAGLTDEEREIHALRVRRMELENALLEGQNAAQWASIMGQPDTRPAPGAPVAVAPKGDGQAGAGAAGIRVRPGALTAPPGQIKAVPSESISSRPGELGLEAARSPAFKEYSVSNRSSWLLPNSQVSEALEGAGEFAAPVLLGGMYANHYIDRLRDWRDSRRAAIDGSDNRFYRHAEVRSRKLTRALTANGWR